MRSPIYKATSGPRRSTIPAHPAPTSNEADVTPRPRHRLTPLALHHWWDILASSLVAVCCELHPELISFLIGSRPPIVSLAARPPADARPPRPPPSVPRPTPACSHGGGSPLLHTPFLATVRIPDYPLSTQQRRHLHTEMVRISGWYPRGEGRPARLAGSIR